MQGKEAFSYLRRVKQSISYHKYATMALKNRSCTPKFQGRLENLGKRQVKSPKIYFRDTGLLHSLLDIPNGHNLLGHLMVGASWEYFVLEQLFQILDPNEECFWGTHAGAELDWFFSPEETDMALKSSLPTPPL